MMRFGEFIARRLPPFIRRWIVVPCPCCGEPARWRMPRLLPLRLLFAPLRPLQRGPALALLALAGIVAMYGTPHVAWDYRCYHGKLYNPRCQAYDYCAYYGLYGRRVVFPEPGEACRLVRLMPAPRTN